MASASAQLQHRLSVYSSYYFFNDVKHSHAYAYNAILPSSLEYAVTSGKWNYAFRFTYWSKDISQKGQASNPAQVYSRNLTMPSIGIQYHWRPNLQVGGGLIYRNGYNLLRGVGTVLFNTYRYEIRDVGGFIGLSWVKAISTSGRWQIKSGVNLYYLFWDKQNGGPYRFEYLDYKTNSMVEFNIGLSFLLNRPSLNN